MKMKYRIIIHFKSINDKESFKYYNVNESRFKKFIKENICFKYKKNMYNLKIKIIKINYKEDVLPIVDIFTV